MPGHNGFRFDDDERISPARVCPTQGGPKEPVYATEPWSRLLSFENGKLLPQSSGFQCKPVARHDQCSNVRDDRNDERTHRSDVSRAAFAGDYKAELQSDDSVDISGFDDPQLFTGAAVLWNQEVVAPTTSVFPERILRCCLVQITIPANIRSFLLSAIRALTFPEARSTDVCQPVQRCLPLRER